MISAELMPDAAETGLPSELQRRSHGVRDGKWVGAIAAGQSPVVHSQCSRYARQAADAGQDFGEPAVRAGRPMMIRTYRSLTA